MNQQQQTESGAKQLERAQYEVEQAKKRFASAMGALQYRLKPGTLMNNAWSGVRDKGSEVADDALNTVGDLAEGAVYAVKERPVAASGVAAALVIFLARAPLWRAASRIFSRSEPDDDGIVTAHLDDPETSYDLTAPTVARSIKEGAIA